MVQSEQDRRFRDNEKSFGGRAILVTGDKHCGKSTLVETMISSLKGHGLAVAGILAKGLWKDNLRSGFDLVNLSDGSITPLARRRENPDPQNRLMFDFFDEGMRAGAKALDPRECRQADILVVDEVGKLEAGGGGWATGIEALLPLEKPLFILIVRLDCMTRIVDRFRLHGSPVIDARGHQAIDMLLAAVNQMLSLPQGEHLTKTKNQHYTARP